MPSLTKYLFLCFETDLEVNFSITKKGKNKVYFGEMR